MLFFFLKSASPEIYLLVRPKNLVSSLTPLFVLYATIICMTQSANQQILLTCSSKYIQHLNASQHPQLHQPRQITTISPAVLVQYSPHCSPASPLWPVSFYSRGQVTSGVYSKSLSIPLSVKVLAAEMNSGDRCTT